MRHGPNSEVVFAEEANEEIRQSYQSELGIGGCVTVGSWAIAEVVVPLYQVEPSCQVQEAVGVYTPPTLVVRHFEDSLEEQSLKWVSLLRSFVGSLR
jgi:hypothetical protein